jgi:hypothetical protein
MKPWIWQAIISMGQYPRNSQIIWTPAPYYLTHPEASEGKTFESDRDAAEGGMRPPCYQDATASTNPSHICVALNSGVANSTATKFEGAGKGAATLVDTESHLYRSRVASQVFLDNFLGYGIIRIHHAFCFAHELLQYNTIAQTARLDARTTEYTARPQP